MTSKTNITATVEPAEDGHGFVAIVKADGVTIYDSSSKHGKQGIFEGENEARDHADAWADCERLIEERTEAVRADRRNRLGGQILVLSKEETEDRQLAVKLKTAAKTAEQNADARADRVKALARHAEHPRLRIHWDRKSPNSVALQIEESEWDEPFVPEEIDFDDKQLSLPGTNWKFETGAEGLTRAIGHGRVEVVIENGEITIMLGADEHRISGKLVGDLQYVESRSSTPKPRGKAIKPVIGKLGIKVLRERIVHIKRAETLLGMYMLELQRAKPRTKVLAAITNAAGEVEDPRLLDDLATLDDGRKSTIIRADVAAAALVTMAGDPPADVLEQLVPECGDRHVINDLVDDEMQRGEGSRDHVLTVLRQRLAELAPTVDEPEDESEEQLDLVAEDEDENDGYGYGEGARFDA